MMLKNKVAVIYGAGGGIGGAVARAFALEGANVFLTGLRLGRYDQLPGGLSPPSHRSWWAHNTTAGARGALVSVRSVVQLHSRPLSATKAPTLDCWCRGSVVSSEPGDSR
jgi:NAD(P)-dependent dehydrogenase (short-subunit alcohol dehydrogenase family)